MTRAIAPSLVSNESFVAGILGATPANGGIDDYCGSDLQYTSHDYHFRAESSGVSFGGVDVGSPFNHHVVICFDYLAGIAVVEDIIEEE